MKAIFLSDAHLKDSRSPGYRALMAFLSRLRFEGGDESVTSSGAGAGKETKGEVINGPSLPVTDLFLVGDIFDFWFSRKGRIYPDFGELIARLRDLKAQGVAVHLCEGNHDFFLKEYFNDMLKMTVYEDIAVIERDGRRLFVAHGDLIDQTNVQYLRLRKFLRSPFIYYLQRILPLTLLWGIARWSSSMSKEIMGGAEDKIARAMGRFAQDRFIDGYDAVILGHCHRPGLEETTIDGKPRIFVTLGDWLRHHTYLYYNEGRFELGRQKME
ncbi:MAG: UDP-2,3-diacylglucosamine hydrolase [Syntrophus sp. SKADARSKE-3]|nr:UDP-2,3-diacylglucosamine hydrolase [Syntrophus sp. SKADARSKE-3]